MALSDILSLLREHAAYRTLLTGLVSTPPRMPEAPLGLLRAARPAALAVLHAHIRRPMLVLAARADTARAMTQQIQVWSSYPRAIMRLPDPDALPYERIAWSRDTVCERMRVLAALAAWPAGYDTRFPPLVVASTRSLMQKTVPPAALRAEMHSLRVGQRVNLHELLARWLQIGYRTASTVEEPGAFSRRGGIVDIFPSHQPYPVRIELFGDEIESLRTFDPLTQRSEQRIDRFEIVPAHEALARLGPSTAQAVQRLDFSACHPAARFGFDEDMARLEQSEGFRGIEFYLPFFYATPVSPLSYLPQDGLLIVEDPLELTTVMGELEAQARDLARDLERQGELPRGMPVPYFTSDELVGEIRRRPYLIAGHDNWPGAHLLPPPSGLESGGATPPLRTPVSPLRGERQGTTAGAGLLSEVFTAAASYGGQVKRLADDLLERRQAGEQITLVSRQAARLAELLSERGVSFGWGEAVPTVEEMIDLLSRPSEAVETITIKPAVALRAGITLVQGMLAPSEGWILNVAARESEGTGEVARSILLTDAEIFGHYKPEPRRRSPFARRAAAPETFLTDLQPGDYVVHVEHGIGVFRGLVKLNLEGIENEYLQVDYAANDKLYVPIHQADRLSRYVGVDDKPPAFNRLGTADWATVKRRAKRAVEEIAQELLEIYAAREIAPGFAFQPDSTWQQELEASFPYVETDDQLRAIEQVKRDMEKPKPMDRLICGDVGYGKTEVALRAAFKAVMAGMQVALLVPTTVLAQQHYQTFAERLKPYPVAVEMLSRFRSRKEQQAVLAGMQAGKVDIVIGTHRLLQKDIHFKLLGLLIIDEEQRFGVSHKERLKKMRTEVDVLTLTATPIPRTLYMSLSGVRDMSTIDTPPAERMSIKTAIAEYDETLIRTAILREMDRGGQVYFVHNRVMGITQLAQRVQKLAPEARVAVAHGQMPESRLEHVMMDFVAGKYDVLVCTSIIESGLDIPNANTIVINQAHHFGLAQLYQLRGRVGRGAVRAYAYLFTPRDMAVGRAARKRLEALAEASDLGAGFRIAMRDLEIRGAGDMLGARQHGHIAAVGFDLYTRLLAQAVRELHNGKQSPSGSPLFLQGGSQDDETLAYLAPLQEGIQINLPLQVYLPEDYVPDAVLRLRLYRRMAGLVNQEEVEAMGQELTDRFGELPEPVHNLLYQLRLKVLALESDIQSINIEAGQIVVKAEGLENLNRDTLQRYTGPAVRVSRRQMWLPLHPNPSAWQAELERVLRLMHRMIHDPGR